MGCTTVRETPQGRTGSIIIISFKDDHHEFLQNLIKPNPIPHSVRSPNDTRLNAISFRENHLAIEFLQNLIKPNPIPHSVRSPNDARINVISFKDNRHEFSQNLIKPNPIPYSFRSPNDTRGQKVVGLCDSYTNPNTIGCAVLDIPQGRTGERKSPSHSAISPSNII
ncbi:hypothetical protein CDAR_69221 [Caerostris darwini]|uniref:Uncharacterized protein n=1 Tax=Caerostris darwini TaxID=1538125 RepID=A0AAV4U0I9_9ARAC|nr:hypothetical protein CDAR_69221 [Caerostris darwini]